MRQLITALTLTLCSAMAFAQSTEDGGNRRSMPQAKNIFGFNPVHVTEENVGFSLSLEHFMDDRGMVSLYLPVSYATAQNNGSFYDDPYYGSYYPGMPLQSYYEYNKGMVYFYPGIKAYPFGAFKKVSYAVGANLLVGFGAAERVTSNYRLDSTLYPGGGYYYNRLKINENTDNVSRMKMGVMVSNSLNMRPGKHLYLGLELAVGYTYINKTGSTNNGSDAVVQAGFKFGYVK